MTGSTSSQHGVLCRCIGLSLVAHVAEQQIVHSTRASTFIHAVKIMARTRDCRSTSPMRIAIARPIFRTFGKNSTLSLLVREWGVSLFCVVRSPFFDASAQLIRFFNSNQSSLHHPSPLHSPSLLTLPRSSLSFFSLSLSLFFSAHPFLLLLTYPP